MKELKKLLWSRNQGKMLSYFTTFLLTMYTFATIYKNTIIVIIEL